MAYKLSVTIPVYNTSRFLRKCLDSLISQTLKDIEFIIVDDGSTDESCLICDQYASKDSRFKVIHQKNGGLAFARQTGLSIAQGEYIIVCDSDDWVEPDIYEKLYNKAKETNADIVTCDYFAEYDDGRSIKRQFVFKERDGRVDNMDFLAHGAGCSWIKLIKKSLFVKTNSYYESGINLSEDSLIHYKLMRGNPKIVQIRESLYHYRRQCGGTSYTNSISMHHVNQLRFTYDWLKNNYKLKEHHSIIRQRAIDIAFAYLRANDTNEHVMKDFLFNEIRWKDFSNDRMSLKKMFVYSLKILPLKISKLLLKNIYPYFYK